MKIAFYNPYWDSRGGGEKYMASLAEAVSGCKDFEVTILSNDPSRLRGKLEGFFQLDLSAVRFSESGGNRWNVRPGTRDYDLLVGLMNYRWIRHAARRTVCVVQVPYGAISPATIGRKLVTGDVKEAGKDFFRLSLLRHLREDVHMSFTYSAFVSETLKKHHQVPNEVLPPPIQDFSLDGVTKKNIVLSVGRFFSGIYNNKRYDILTDVFRNVSRTHLAGWEYHIIGSAASDSNSQRTISHLRQANEGFPVILHVNEPYQSLRRLYNEATMLWHAAGYGVDTERHPENAEHFGMTTVEAMSAGCIPVVINNGGQREIVAHGASGFLWETTDELIAHSSAIASGTLPLESLRAEARRRYREYSLERFREKALEFFQALREQQ